MNTKTEKLLKLIRSENLPNKIETDQDCKMVAKTFLNLINKFYKDFSVFDKFYEQKLIEEFDARTIDRKEYSNLEKPSKINISSIGQTALSLDTEADTIAIATFRIQAAVSIFNEYLKAGLSEHFEKAFIRLMKEILYKNDIQAVLPILHSLSEWGPENGDSRIFRSKIRGEISAKDLQRVKLKIFESLFNRLSDEEKKDFKLPKISLITSSKVAKQVKNIREDELLEGVFDFDIVETGGFEIGGDYNNIFKSFSEDKRYENYKFNLDEEEIAIFLINQPFKSGLVKTNIIDFISGNRFQLNWKNLKGEYGELEINFSEEASYMSICPENMVGVII